LIVLDASAAIEWLLRTTTGKIVEQRIFSSAETLHTPHLLDAEVAQVIRKYVVAGVITADRGREAIEDLLSLPLARYPHIPLLGRVWELRATLTAYDAMYVALAEALRAPLLTGDRKIAAASGHRAHIELI
jgi:predicted nucleic acid-binding protein